MQWLSSFISGTEDHEKQDFVARNIFNYSYKCWQPSRENSGHTCTVVVLSLLVTLLAHTSGSQLKRYEVEPLWFSTQTNIRIWSILDPYPGSTFKGRGQRAVRTYFKGHAASCPLPVPCSSSITSFIKLVSHSASRSQRPREPCPPHLFFISQPYWYY